MLESTLTLSGPHYHINLSLKFSKAIYLPISSSSEIDNCLETL